MYDFAKANGFITNEQQMVDAGGHQVAHIEYPGLPKEYVMEMVHKFYDEYYFRPKAIFRIVRKAFFNGEERRRLTKEAKAFLTLRAARNKAVKQARKNPVAPVLTTTKIAKPNAPSGVLPILNATPSHEENTVVSGD